MWLSSKQDLRINLSDGPTDRYHFRKRVFGELNGTNLRFKTFDDRRITDFTLVPSVYLNGVLLSVTDITSDSLYTGEFLVLTPPVDGDILEASYYTQWFLDAELDDFLKQATLWCLSTDDVTAVTNGLIPAVLSYACSRAYLKMAIRAGEYKSDEYKVEDAPRDSSSVPNSGFAGLSQKFKEEAEAQRKEFYTRQDQNLQPLFGTISGRVRSFP